MSVMASGCYRGERSDKPPVHLNPNMDTQEKYKPQAEGDFFEDHSTMETPVAGVVAREYLRDDDAFYRGIDENGNFLKESPVPLTEEGLARGRERFGIYCAVCHGPVGDGKSIMVEKQYIPPPTYHQDRLRQMPDGEIFNTVSNGLRNMPSYKNQIPVMDRWQIIHYLRALQRSQDATISDVPPQLREELKKK